MKFKDSLSDIFGSKIKVDILRYFVRNSGHYTGREIAKLVGYSHPAVNSALNELHSARIVFKEKIGNAYLYSLNNEHVLADNIKSLFEAERAAIDAVVEKFAEELEGKLDSIIIFGSVARGESTYMSDIDMVISFKRGVDPQRYRRNVDLASSETIAATGSSVDYFLIRHSELMKKMQGKEVRGMWKDIFGKEPAILFQPKGDKLDRSYFPRGEWMKTRLLKGY